MVEALEPVRDLLFELQADAGLSRWNDTLLVDLRFAGIVEAWAAGASWSQIMEDSTLDDGDVARLLIRTADLLKQVGSATTHHAMANAGSTLISFAVLAPAIILACLSA